MALQRPLVLLNGIVAPLAAADTAYSDGKDRQALVLATTQTVGGTALSSVVGMSFALKANAQYWVSWQVILSQASVASTNGLALSYSSTFSQMAFNAFMINSLTAGTYRVQTTNATAMLMAATQAIGTTLPINIVGTITTTGAGNLIMQAQRSAGVCTVLLGSGGMLVQV
jgi:hypothetical protein